VVSFKDWYRALCFMIPILAVLERPDMPKAMLGIPGANPFNFMLVMILMGWFLQRKRQHQTWGQSATINFLLLSYAIVGIIGFLRMYFDNDGVGEIYTNLGIEVPNGTAIIKDQFINVFKWTIPGLLICYGATTPQRFNWMVFSILLAGMLLALQIIKNMVPALISGEDIGARALRVLGRDIGYHRVDLSPLMASVSWAFFFFSSNFKGGILRFAALSGFLMAALAMILTGGRLGFVSWLVLGLIIAIVRYRKLLIVGPLLVITLIPLLPGVQERLFEGFDSETHESLQSEKLDTIDSEGRDTYAITSGRIVVWPLVLEKIWESPYFGYGMNAMMRAGVVNMVHDLIGQWGFAHPHNAYLELVLDAGIIGALPILCFFAVLLFKARPRFFALENPVEYQAAALVIAFVLIQLIASFGGQSFYAREGVALMWCSIGLFLSTLKKDRMLVVNAAETTGDVPLPDLRQRWQQSKESRFDPKTAFLKQNFSKEE
jgi:O-antigen ligase